MVVPGKLRRQNQIALFHEALLAVDGGVRATSLERMKRNAVKVWRWATACSPACKYCRERWIVGVVQGHCGRPGF